MTDKYKKIMEQLYDAETERGTRIQGYLSVLNFQHEHIEPGFYISNAADQPFAYKVKPETLTEIKHDR